MFGVSPERVRLERRPEATSFQVDDLLAKVESGVLRLPDFQRKLKWQVRDKLDLFDSLYRGFPIGTLLLWKAAAPAGTVTFDELSLEVSARPDALWIVDGQQRVTTLASSLLVPRGPKQRTLLFDLVNERFLYGPPPDEEPSLSGMTEETQLVAVQDLFDSKRAIAWMAARMKTLRPEFVQRALECGKRLREYQLPVYIVETSDEDVLREIFDRINRTGRRLDDTDVFTALFATKGAQGERLDLGHVARRVARLGFGTFEEKTVLLSLRAVMDLPLDKDFTRSMERAGSAAALMQTEAALERTARFLREAGIPHVALLPYSLIAVVLARFFDRHPEPRARNLVLLRRWLWRGSLAGKLTGATVSLRQHVEAVSSDEDASAQALLRLDSVAEDGPVLDLGVFRLDTAKSKLAACALASLHPRDLRSGEVLDVAALFDIDPKRPLPEICAGLSSEHAKSVVNRLLHPPMRGKDAAKAVLEADPLLLASHTIPVEARAALARGEADTFLAIRAVQMRAVFERFFRSQAEYGADDSPALDSIVVDEDL
ncbi:MAG TPA: DUF262 domain-containing protein [Labilithrix sp.]|nr:DUF262 domain-containing protein [Labilithrix sp.]